MRNYIFVGALLFLMILIGCQNYKEDPLYQVCQSNQFTLLIYNGNCENYVKYFYQSCESTGYSHQECLEAAQRMKELEVRREKELNDSLKEMDDSMKIKIQEIKDAREMRKFCNIETNKITEYCRKNTK